MKRPWIGFWSVIIISFVILGWAGVRIYQEKPPIPKEVVTTDGKTIIHPGEVSEGQNVWQALGGMELGSVFSALEAVPLTLVGYEGWRNLRLSRSAVWVEKYKWPIYYFIAVAFWNLVGAGLFGFMINPPIALYYWG